MRIGVDLLHVQELNGLLERERFRRYAYCAEELAIAQDCGPQRAAEFLTGRYAAKEAVAKVLGCGFGSGVAPRQIALPRSPEGAPRVHLSGAAARRAAELGVARLPASITHKNGLVIAVALGVPADACAVTDPAAELARLTGEIGGRAANVPAEWRSRT